jgi:hypothetical protein
MARSQAERFGLRASCGLRDRMSYAPALAPTLGNESADNLGVGTAKRLAVVSLDGPPLDGRPQSLPRCKTSTAM